MLAMFDRCGGRGDGVLPAAALVKLYVRAFVRAQRCSQSSWRQITHFACNTGYLGPENGAVEAGPLRRRLADVRH